MVDVWFTADSHFSHNNIIGYENRPFLNVRDMNDYLIQQWNKVIKPNDVVFHLGDLFFGPKEEQENISKALNGRKHLILGNHDKLSKTRYRNLGFNPCNYYVFENYLLSHRPQQEIPLQSLIQNSNIVKNIHGHVHSNTRNLNPDIHFCVSVELNDYMPFHYDEIKKSNGR